MILKNLIIFSLIYFKKRAAFAEPLLASETIYTKVTFLRDIYNPPPKCEKQELNLRTPSGTDLESASVGHLDILAPCWE